MSESFVVEPRGPFSLAAAARFLGRWEATAGAAADETAVRLAFLVDDWSGHAGVVIRQDAAGVVRGEIVSRSVAVDPDRVRRQVMRVLSLDHDATGYAELGGHDPIVGERQRATNHLRPVLFHSPYEAACWAIVSARISSAQAASVRAGMSATIDVAGQPLAVFPAPEELLARSAIAGLPAEKVRRLHGIAEAALDGRLDAARLLTLDPEAATGELRGLRGIGPFWSDAIVLRAVGHPDALTLREPRLRAAVAAAYDRDDAEYVDAAFTAIAQGWRPFRAWVSFLIRATSGRGSGG